MTVPTLLQALGNLAFRNAANQEKAAHAGGIVACVNAMKLYQTHTSLLENGAAALGNICGSTNNQVWCRCGAALLLNPAFDEHAVPITVLDDAIH